MERPPALLIHGFTGGAFELEPLSKLLDERGIQSYLPEMPWSGARLIKRKKESWEDWLSEVTSYAQRFSMEYDKFDLVGFSLGGMVAAYLANHFPVRRLVLVNAAVIYVSPVRFIRNFGANWKQTSMRENIQLNKVSPHSVWQFIRLVRYTRKEISKLKVPTLIAQSMQDSIVHPHSAAYIHKHIQGTSCIYTYEQSNHQLCLGPEKDLAVAHITEFLERQEGS